MERDSNPWFLKETSAFKTDTLNRSVTHPEQIQYIFKPLCAKNTENKYIPLRAMRKPNKGAEQLFFFNIVIL